MQDFVSIFIDSWFVAQCDTVLFGCFTTRHVLLRLMTLFRVCINICAF